MVDLCKNMNISGSSSVKQRKNEKTLEAPVNYWNRRRKNQLLQNALDTKKRDEETRALEMRIKKREEEEAKKERELILRGKLKPTPAQLRSDKILQIYERVRTIEQKAKDLTENKHKKTIKTAPKWKSAVSKMKLPKAPFKSVPMFTEEFGKLVKEQKDDTSEQLHDMIVEAINDNPIHKSFAAAKSVDDLYELAEYWLSPSVLNDQPSIN